MNPVKKVVGFLQYLVDSVDNWIYTCILGYSLMGLGDIRKRYGCIKCPDSKNCNLFLPYYEEFYDAIEQRCGHQFAQGIVECRDLKGPAMIGRPTEDSMLPTFRDGDLSISLPFSTFSMLKWELRVGDIIAYSYIEFKEGRWEFFNDIVLHRIIKVNDDGTFIVKGDNNDGPDVFEDGSHIPVKAKYIHYVNIGRIRDNEITFWDDERTLEAVRIHDVKMEDGEG